MGWLDGWLTGFADRHRQIEQENLALAQKASEREGRVFEALLNSRDPEVRGMAATGLIAGTQPLKRKSGLSGWIGEMQSNPMYPKLMNYINTPQLQGYEDIPGTGIDMTAKQAGYKPSLPDVTPGTAAQPSTQTTTPGAPGPTPQQPAPQPITTPPPPPPGFTGAPDSLITTQPPPPPGFTGAPRRDPFVYGPGAPRPIQMPTPVPGPPEDQLPPADLRTALAGASPNVPLATPPPALHVPPQQRAVYGLPHAFPTAEEHQIAQERGRIRGIVESYADVSQATNPNLSRQQALAEGWKQYQAEHARMTGVVEGDTQQVSGALARSLGVPEGTWMQPLYDKQSGQVVHWIPGGDKASGKALSVADRAARSMGLGFERASDVPNELMPQFQAKLNEIVRQEASARAGGSAAGKYAEDLARVDPAVVNDTARAIMADAGQMVRLNGHSQAFKDAVAKTISAHGGDVNKISEQTRAQAEQAKDMLKVMDKVAPMAQQLNALGYMGPAMGRWTDFLAGTYGSLEMGAKTPQERQLISEFRDTVDLLKSGVIKAHAGMRGAGSEPILDHFERLLSSRRMDYDDFIGALRGFHTLMATYAEHLPDPKALWGTPGVETGAQPGAPAAAADLEAEAAAAKGK